MISKLRQNMGLADAARMRTAIANMAAEAGRVRPGDPALTQVLGDIGLLIENVDSSLAQYEAGNAVVARAGGLAADELQAVNRRIEHELCAGSKALETLHQGFSGRLRVNPPRSAEAFRYRPGPQAERRDAPPAASSLPQCSAQSHCDVAADDLFVCDILPDGKSCLWQKAFEASADAIIITDAEERIVLVNRAVTEITGYTADEVLGNTPRMFQSGRQDRNFYRTMWATILSTGHWQGEIWDRRKNGEIYPKWMTVSAVPDHAGRIAHYIALFSDITLRKNHEAQIQFLAYHDSLTGLPNRRRLEESFEVEAAHARRNGCKLHLLFIDLDHFKNINDTLGHAVGDKFLQGITARLKSCLRTTDILSRLGGDEFVIALSDTHGVVDLPNIVDKLAASMAAPLDIDCHALKASASIGIGIFPDDGEDFDDLLQKADTAMYQAKQQGRGRYCYFDAGMNAAAQERIVMQSHLRDALERGELFLHYQPRADLGLRRIAGVEAMLRWQSPILGNVGPDRFVPLAEDSGLMSRIGEWTLREVCRQAGAWHAAGWSGLTVSLKLMPSQSRRRDIVEVLARALSDSGVDAGCIELGFSEACMIQGKEAIMDTARSLKELGVGLYLDGFGCGYSSLWFLNRCGVDRVKLDRALVYGLPEQRDNAGIVCAAIQTANCLGLGVIADGVASESQIAFLRQAGCDLGQGPLFGQPQADPLPLQMQLAAASRS